MFYRQSLRKIRKEKKITGAKLAEWLHKTRETVSAWERGMHQPCDGDIRMMAQLLNVPVSDISDLKELKNGNDGADKQDLCDLDLTGLSHEAVTRLKDLHETCLEFRATNTRLRSNLFKYDILLQNLPFAIYVKDKRLKYTYVNEKFLNLIERSYSRNSISGTSSFDLFGMKEYSQVLELEQKVLQTKERISSQQIFIPGTFKKKIGLLTIIPILNDNRDVEELVGSIEDITDTYEEEKRRKELEAVVNKTNHMIWIGESVNGGEDDFKHSFISDNIIDVFGIEKQEAFKNHLHWLRLVHEDDVEKATKWDLENWGEGDNFPKKIEYKINNPKKGVRWILSEIYKEGKNKFYGIVTDITEEKEREREKEAILRTLNAATDAITIAKIKDEKKEYIYVNSANKNLYELPLAKIKNNPEYWKEFIHPEDKDKIILADEKKKEGHLHLNYRLLMPDQRIKHVEESTFKEIIDGASYSGTIKRDVTKEKDQINEKVLEIKNFLTLTINCLGSNHWWKDLNGVYRGANRATVEMLNMSVEDVIGKTDYDLPWKDQAASLIKNDLKVIKSGKTIKFVENVKTKGEEIKCLMVTKSPLRDSEGKIIGTIGSSVDVTDIKRIETMLLNIT